MPEELGQGRETARRLLLAELRRLRSGAGEPSYRRIASDIGTVSHTTVADVFEGRSVPSWRTLTDLANHFGGSSDYLRQLWTSANTPQTYSRPDQGISAAGVFVGRQAELGLLHGWLAEAGLGASTVCFLTGESGIGKSELLTQFAASVSTQATVLSGACINLDSVFPYAPLVEALRRWVRGEGEERVRTLAGPAWDQVSALIAEFTGSGPAEGDRYSGRAMLGAVSRMLEHVARSSPVVLIFEDLQWADPATFDLVTFLVQALPVERMMLVCTYRTPLPAHHRLRSMMAEPDLVRRVHSMTLHGLTAAELNELLITSGHRPAREQLDRYAELTGGNPYFSLQLASAGGPVDRVPPTLTDMLMARLGQLSEYAVEVVRAVAVAGRQISDEALARVTSMESHQQERATQECLDRAILVFDRASRTYQFRHRLIREVVYETLPSPTRIRLHHALARALSAESAATATPLEVAYHWYEARLWPEALASSVSAGAFAVRMTAFADAETLYERALSLWPRVENPQGVAAADRHHLLLAGADAARWAGHIQKALSYLEEAISDVDPSMSPQRAAELCERLGSYLWEADASGRRSAEAYLRAYDLVQNEPPSAIRARILAGLSTASIRSGSYEPALTQARRALAEARTVKARAVEGRALNSTGLALTLTGRLDEGIADLNEAVRIGREVNHLEDLLRAYANLGLALEEAGRLTDAAAVLRNAQEEVVARGLRDTRQGRLLVNNLSAILVLLGEWDPAEKLLDSLLTDQPVRESLYQRLTRAEVHVARGEFGRAQLLLDQIRPESANDPRFIGPLYCCIAEAALWQYDPKTALDAVSKGISAVASSGHQLSKLQICAVGLRAVADLRDPDHDRANRGASEPDRWLPTANDDSWPRLTTHADRMIRLVEPMIDTAVDPSESSLLAHLCQAEYARAQGTDSDAAWSQIADGWTALSRPYPAAYARWRQAGAGLRDQHRKTAATAAHAAFVAAERLGAAPLAGRVKILIGENALRASKSSLASTSRSVPHPVRESRFGLTHRELEVLELVVAGSTNRSIARALRLSESTVAVHVHHICQKLEVRGRAEAVARAVKEGLVPEESPPHD